MQDTKKQLEISLSDETVFNIIFIMTAYAKIFNFTDLPWFNIIAAYILMLIGFFLYEIGKKLIELLRSKQKNARG